MHPTFALTALSSPGPRLGLALSPVRRRRSAARPRFLLAAHRRWLQLVTIVPSAWQLLRRRSSTGGSHDSSVLIVNFVRSVRKERLCIQFSVNQFNQKKKKKKFAIPYECFATQ